MPDFVVIGAMKCATSTLHEQLARQPGFFMSEPKEPFFFSNDEVYARGLAWYTGLFARAPSDALCGESSTHYTKLPTYPRTVTRMRKHVSNAKLIYVMRHPVKRLVSQYIHEWSEGTVPSPIDQAVLECPRLVDYSRYSMQLRPFLDAYGPEAILPVFLERMVSRPQAELERVCTFLGYRGTSRWRADAYERNKSSQRLRKSRLRDAVVWNPLVTWVRRRYVPQSWRDRVKRFWQMQGRPQLDPGLESELVARFDEDLGILGGWLGVKLSCDTFEDMVVRGPLDFVGCTRMVKE